MCIQHLNLDVHTSKVDKVGVAFPQRIFEEILLQKWCLIAINVVYIKPSLTLHDIKVFGKASDHSDKLSKPPAVL